MRLIIELGDDFDPSEDALPISEAVQGVCKKIEDGIIVNYDEPQFYFED